MARWPDVLMARLPDVRMVRWPNVPMARWQMSVWPDNQMDWNPNIYLGRWLYGLIFINYKHKYISQNIGVASTTPATPLMTPPATSGCAFIIISIVTAAENKPQTTKKWFPRGCSSLASIHQSFGLTKVGRPPCYHHTSTTILPFPPTPPPNLSSISSNSKSRRHTRSTPKSSQQ